MRALDPGQRAYPLAVVAVGVFLLFGSSMAILAGTLLLWPGTVLDKFWTLNPLAHRTFAPFASFIAPLFYGLGVVLMIAAAGCFKQRIWGWRLTVAIIATQVVGDFVNLLRGNLLRGSVGLLIAGTLLVFLLRSNFRTMFQ